MIPELRLSSQPVVAPYLEADALPRQRLQDFEMGGAAIGDPSQGLQVQVWELRVLGRDVRVRPFPNGQYTLLFQDSDITRIGLAFDQNMRPAVAYVANGVTKLWWFDPRPAQQRNVFTAIPGARDPVICLDDKRPGQRDFSDILLFYLKDDPSNPLQTLYMRAQRDRYGVEYAIGQLPQRATSLRQVGMTTAGRLRFLLSSRPVEDSGNRRPLPPLPGGGGSGLVLQFSPAQHFQSAGVADFKFEFEFYYAPASDPL